MDVREILPAEWPEILAAWPEDPSAIASLYDEDSRTRTVLVAWDGSAPQGYGVVQWEGPVAPNARAAFAHAIELNHLWVFDSARGKGAGTALIRAAEQAAAARGHTQVLVRVGEDNPEARRLYERLGYTATGVWATTTYMFRGDDGSPTQTTETDATLVKHLPLSWSACGQWGSEPAPPTAPLD